MFDTWIMICIILLVSSSAIFTILNNYKLQETLETLKKAGMLKEDIPEKPDTPKEDYRQLDTPKEDYRQIDVPKEDYRQLEINRTVPLYLLNASKFDILTETQDQMQGELNRRQELLINEHNSKGEQTQWYLPYFISEEDREKSRVNLSIKQRYKVIPQDKE